MKRLAVSYLSWVLLPPIFYFKDDWLSREHGWGGVALLPAQIEITIFSLLNGKISGGPWFNCILKQNKTKKTQGEQGNEKALTERSRDKDIHQRPESQSQSILDLFTTL